MLFFVLYFVIFIGVVSLLVSQYTAYTRVTKLRRWSLGGSRFDPDSATKSRWSGKKWLIIVNPFSGTKTGDNVFRQIISPICAKLRIEVTPFYSERCKHVEEFIGNHKGGISQKYDTVILVSGDGTLQEFLNGLFISCGNSEEKYLNELKCISLGIIPAGSMNGLAYSFYKSVDPLDCFTKIIESTPQPVDLWRITQYSRDGNVLQTLYDCTNFSCGITAEHDELQERKMRNFPSFLRHIVPPLAVIARFPSFSGRFLFRQTPMESGGYYNSGETFKNASDLPEFKEISGDITIFLASNIPHAGSDVCVSTLSKPGEGAMDVVLTLTKNMSRIFLDLETGKHVNSDKVIVVKTKEMYLVPRSPTYMSLSGEKIPTEKTHIEVLPLALKVLF